MSEAAVACPEALHRRRLQKNQRLHCFPEAHIVRQATAEAVVVQEVQPVKAGLLVVPQFAAEARRQRASVNLREIPQ